MTNETQKISWGIVLCTHAAVKNAGGLYTVRALLGLFVSHHPHASSYLSQVLIRLRATGSRPVAWDPPSTLLLVPT